MTDLRRWLGPAWRLKTLWRAERQAARLRARLRHSRDTGTEMQSSTRRVADGFGVTALGGGSL